MTMNLAGAALFIAAMLIGTVRGSWQEPPQVGGGMLVADLHVHPFPGDGALTAGQLRREARRRGLDVIALTGHNNLLGWRLGRSDRSGPDGVIVLSGQEVTAPAFHLIAAGITEVIDWRLPVRQVIAAVHSQGGAAIAAHPVDGSWLPRDNETLALLDGAEVAHPAREQNATEREQLDRFFDQARAAKSGLSPVGSSDFHMAAPLGRCRTYLFADERSAAGVIRALRSGNTVAECGEGPLFGAPELVERVKAGARPANPVAVAADRGAAAAALLGLALLCTRVRRR